MRKLNKYIIFFSCYYLLIGSAFPQYQYNESLTFVPSDDNKANKIPHWELITENLYNFLTALWMNSDGTEGWAVGVDGEILHYQNEQWQINTQIITGISLSAIWMNSDGTEGWAVGSRGEILYYKNKLWQKYTQSEQITENNLTAIWMNSAGTEGWAVGYFGEILHYQNKQWQKYPQQEPITD